MLQILRHRAFALIALLAFALGTSGHAHRAPSALDEALAAYMMAGVTLSDICGMEGMEPGAQSCPLCRVDPGYLPPEPLRLARPILPEAKGLSLAEARYVAPGPVRIPSQGPRAPPVHLI